jgi:8-oxo-dGTP pyrophosphatase MutT (NUDIX family)
MTSAKPASAPTHAGGVVYRLKGRAPEFLLVTARRDPDSWVLPKGHIEPGESPEQTAIREVLEESGVSATIEDFLGQVHVRVRGQRQLIKYYLMPFHRQGSGVEGRAVAWMNAEQAARHLRFPELQLLIEKAASMTSASKLSRV